MKTIIITGGTSGIGLATAKIFLKQGYNCVIVGRSPERFEKVHSDLTGSIFFLQADVRKILDCERIVQKTVERFGAIDALVNCAGIYFEGSLIETNEKDFEEVFEINVKGTFFMIRAAIVELAKTNGSIVNLASDAGIRGNYFCAVYAASKGAILALTRSLALELASFQIRVNCVAPGDIFTPMTEKQLKKSGETVEELARIYPLKRIGRAEEVAAAIYFLVSDAASFITGTTLSVDGGLTA